MKKAIERTLKHGFIAAVVFATLSVAVDCPNNQGNLGGCNQLKNSTDDEKLQKSAQTASDQDQIAGKNANSGEAE